MLLLQNRDLGAGLYLPAPRGPIWGAGPMNSGPGSRPPTRRREEWTMSLPEVVNREEWLVARKALLAREKELTRQKDLLNADRRRLPMVAVEKPYEFEGPD